MFRVLKHYVWLKVKDDFSYMHTCTSIIYLTKGSLGILKKQQGESEVKKVGKTEFFLTVKL
jgi:hypothetical protein